MNYVEREYWQWRLNHYEAALTHMNAVMREFEQLYPYVSPDYLFEASRTLRLLCDNLLEERKVCRQKLEEADETDRISNNH